MPAPETDQQRRDREAKELREREERERNRGDINKQTGTQPRTTKPANE